MNQNCSSIISQRALIAFSAIGTFLVLGWLLKYSSYGIDFTDEGNSLVWISNPFAYDVSVTQFGFVYHPLYRLLGGNIVALRQANILITFGLAWSLTYVFLISLAPESREKSIALYAVSAGLATSVFILFEPWFPTPSKNSLALQALLITSIGLLLADKTDTHKSVSGWIIIGVGGWLAFMAKPSTALALAMGVFIYLLFSRKFSIRFLLLAVVIAIVLLFASALLIDSSIMGFVQRLQLGIESGEILDAQHTFLEILRIDRFYLGKKLTLAILVVFALSFLATWGVWKKKKKGLLVSLSISFAFFALTVLLAIGHIHRIAALGEFHGLLIFGVVFAAVLVGVMLGHVKALKEITVSQWAIAGMFLVMPYIYVFGTNNNYWQFASSAAIFWLLAGLTLLGPLRDTCLLVLPLALAAQVVTAILLQTGFEQPYRQPDPLRFNDTNQKIAPQQTTLLLSASYASYLDNAITVARDSGFKPMTPVIDLSGQSPGILYAIGAESIGKPWLLGGYRGSLNFAKAGLARTSCEKIATAWLLLEPNGPRSISTELITSLGAAFPEGYEQVGSWQTAEGAGGFAEKRIQRLYKPINQNETLRVCQALREKEAL